MEKQVERILDKLDKLDDNLSETNKILARNTTSLDYHILRTNMLEDELKPIKKKVAMAEGAIKFLSIVATICGILAFVISNKG